jgi:two-component sensor histidine kinase
VETDLPAGRDAPALARRFAESVAPDLPADVLVDLKLLLSELVTNSVQHGASGPRSEVRVAIDRSKGTLHVTVRDAGSGFERPGRVAVDPTTDHGYGLVMVDRVANRWGVEAGAPTAVWFELDVAAPRGPAAGGGAEAP